MAGPLNSGFTPLGPSDFQGNPFRVNQYFQYLFGKINQLFGTNAPTLLSSPTFVNVKVSGQTQPPTDPTTLISLGSAKQLFAAVGGMTVAQGSPTQSGSYPSTGGTGTSTFGTHANRPTAASATAGSFYYETDRTVLYELVTSGGTPFWQYVAGGSIGTIAGLTTGLGTSDEGFLYYATDFYHLYQWNGANWIFAPGSESSGMIVMGMSAPYPTAAWHICDGSTISVATPAGTLATVTLPPATSTLGPFLRSGTYLGTVATATPATWNTAATAATDMTTLTTNVTLTTATVIVATAATGSTVVTAITATAGDSPNPHHHTLTNANAKLNAPSDTNGGEPANLTFGLYFRI